MLLVNGEQKTAKEAAKMFGIPLEKLQKSSEFTYNETLKGFNMVTNKKDKVPGAVTFPAVFNAPDSEGRNMEIRYAKSKSRVKDKVSGGMNDVFSPRKVSVNGEGYIAESIEECIYIYLNPKCKQSPFRNDTAVPFTYEYKDTEAKAAESINKGDLMLKALNHAKKATGNDLKLVAKGMGIENVDGKSETEIQGDLSAMALANPAFYLSKVEKQATVFDGRIIDAIDRGLFKMEHSFGMDRWVWAAGASKGNIVCEVTSKAISPQEFLRNHIKNNIQEFYAQITNIQNAVNADEVAESFLSQQNKPQVEEDKPVLGAKVNYPVPLDTSNLVFPTNFQECVDYLQGVHEDGKRPSNVLASQLKKAIESGEVNEENIEEYAVRLLKS